MRASAIFEFGARSWMPVFMPWAPVGLRVVRRAGQPERKLDPIAPIRRHRIRYFRSNDRSSLSSGGAISVTRSRISAFFGNGASVVVPSFRRAMQA